MHIVIKIILIVLAVVLYKLLIDKYRRTARYRINTWKRFKKDLRNPGHVYAEIMRQCERDSNNEHFEKFQCSVNFKGASLARENRKLYNARRFDIQKRLKHLYNIQERLEVK